MASWDCSHCRFYKIMGFTASLFTSYSGPLIRVPITIMMFLSRKIR